MGKIKIKKDLVYQETDNRQQLDLKNQPKASKFKRNSRFWLFLSLFLLIVLVILSLKWYLDKPIQDNFKGLISGKSVIYSSIDQQALYSQTSPFYQFLRENHFYAPAISKIENYFNQAGLNYSEIISNGFKSQAGFILLPANQDSPFPFILVMEKKNSFWDLNQELEKIEKYFKKDFNYHTQLYRQIKIKVLNPLQEVKSGFPEYYAYAQIKDYFIVSNSLETLKQTIDNLIN